MLRVQAQHTVCGEDYTARVRGEIKTALHTFFIGFLLSLVGGEAQREGGDGFDIPHATLTSTRALREGMDSGVKGDGEDGN